MTESVTLTLKKTHLFLMVGVVVGLGFGFAGGFWAASVLGRGAASPSAAAPPGAVPPGTLGEAIDVSIEGRPVRGADDAKVTIVEFTDYQCPYCARHFQSTYPALLAEFGDRIKYVIRNFPLSSLHPHAMAAAEAAECAADQGKFWEYHDVLFQRQAALDEESLKRYAAELQLDAARFDRCMESGTKSEVVAEDLDAGTAYGVTGTPTFFVNGRKLVGAQPLQVFKIAIEQAEREVEKKKG